MYLIVKNRSSWRGWRCRRRGIRSHPLLRIHRRDSSTVSRAGDCFTAGPASPALWFAM